MSLTDFFRPDHTVLSYELFPPKTEKGKRSLFDHVQKLMAFQPDFITCTYGAGGSSRNQTLEIITQVKQQFDIPVASHLTLVNSTREQLSQYLKRAQDGGVDFIVALRGDPPEGSEQFQVTAGGFRNANELVELIHDSFPDFGIAVAGYPEKHVEAPDMQTDIEHLKRKVDAGAEVIVTQLFYDNADFFRFRDRCRAQGITVPIVPGLLPLTNLKQVQRITAMCGSKLPDAFVQRLCQREDDRDWHFQVGVQHAIEQANQLIEEHVDGLHFYVLNKSRATAEILTVIRPKGAIF